VGTIGGFRLQREDCAGLGYEALDQPTKAFLAEAAKAPELGRMFIGFLVNGRRSTPISPRPGLELCFARSFTRPEG
jgi:hypothetical protein